VPELASTLLPLLAIFLVFWLLIIRPQRRRAAALQQLRAALSPGDRVMMTAGIFGTLVSIDGDTARVEVADGVVIEFATAAVASVDASGPTGDDVSAPGTDDAREDD
jgi:preprotein translocase subunit YajC